MKKDITETKDKSNIENKKVAAVIVNYNDANRTINLLKEIVNYESINYVIVVNNKSTDNSQENLESFEHDKYILINAKKNGGYGYGNNIGIKKSDEMDMDYTLICNPDIYFSENTLIEMMKYLEQDESCALINAKENYLGNFAWKYTSDLQDVLCTSIVFNKFFSKRYYKNSYFENKDVVNVDILQGSFLLVKTDLMLSFGMYDEEFFLYEEEKVLYKKFHSHGYYSKSVLTESYEHHHIDRKYNYVTQFLTTKQRLIDSKLLFLKKYRNFSSFKLSLSKLFFLLTTI
ncbi:glycosyltransferase [Streptococcus parauberis]|nr:glycosyltransferase [Streptococcus parauberis]